MLDIDFDDSDEKLRDILEKSSVIAMVGESNDHYYSSYQVAQYLKQMGYTVYPVLSPLILWTCFVIRRTSAGLSTRQ